MTRKLIVCCDGTWNTPRSETNIYRTYRFFRERLGTPREQRRLTGVWTCEGHAPDGSEVVLFYDRGVGTNWFERLTGGAAGVGLSDNVQDAYHFLAHRFSPGSEIYVFGFSRGAYTARSLCGFIKVAGLLERPSRPDVWRAYVDLYALQHRVIARPLGWSAARADEWFRETAARFVGRLGGVDVARLPRHEGVKIRFIGVYDTVGALGVPLPEAALLNEPVVGFHDTTLSDVIEHAVHALAVDEKRAPFMPTLWTLGAGQALAASQSALQVWFPGVHSDVGGGYRDKGIGDITWDFMMRQAARRGLVIDSHLPLAAESLLMLPAQHESFNEKWALFCDQMKILPSSIRAIGPSIQEGSGQARTVAGDVRLHPSLLRRFGQRVTTILDEARGTRREGEYKPTNVRADTLPGFTAT